jgi:peptidoglycan/xylan/chitin deacetylase (PgdA/CDA1 family)
VRVPILMYHMVCESAHPLEKRYACRPSVFKRQMSYLKKAGYRVIPLAELAGLLSDKKESANRSVVLTFDDGFRDNYLNASPVLQAYGFPATIFVVSGLWGQTNQWMSGNGYPVRKLATMDELLQMSENGIEVGSHTVSHAPLDVADSEKLAREVRSSKEDIEQRLGKPVRFFAYPYGRLNEAARNAVAEAGYKAACSTRSGFNNTGTDPFILRRLEVYGTDSLWRFALKLAWGTNDASSAVIGRYYLSRLKERLK